MNEEKNQSEKPSKKRRYRNHRYALLSIKGLPKPITNAKRVTVGMHA